MISFELMYWGNTTEMNVGRALGWEGIAVT